MTRQTVRLGSCKTGTPYGQSTQAFALVWKAAAQTFDTLI